MCSTIVVLSVLSVQHHCRFGAKRLSSCSWPSCVCLAPMHCLHCYIICAWPRMYVDTIVCLCVWTMDYGRVDYGLDMYGSVATLYGLWTMDVWTIDWTCTVVLPHCAADTCTQTRQRSAVVCIVLLLYACRLRVPQSAMARVASS